MGGNKYPCTSVVDIVFEDYCSCDGVLTRLKWRLNSTEEWWEKAMTDHHSSYHTKSGRFIWDTKLNKIECAVVKWDPRFDFWVNTIIICSIMVRITATCLSADVYCKIPVLKYQFIFQSFRHATGRSCLVIYSELLTRSTRHVNLMKTSLNAR